jgi:hypothetical protein
MLDVRVSASIQAALLFLIIGSPLVYNLTNTIFGRVYITSYKGCATTYGLILHAIVYGLLGYLLMSLGSKSRVTPVLQQDTDEKVVYHNERQPPVTAIYVPEKLAYQMGPSLM